MFGLTTVVWGLLVAALVFCFAWEFCLTPSFGNFRLVWFAFAWAFSLEVVPFGHIRLGTFGWDPSLGKFRLGCSVGHLSPGNGCGIVVSWHPSIGYFFVWDMLLGNFRVETFV